MGVGLLLLTVARPLRGLEMYSDLCYKLLRFRDKRGVMDYQVTISSLQHRYTNLMQMLYEFWVDPSMLYDCYLWPTQDDEFSEEKIGKSIVSVAIDYYNELEEYLTHEHAYDMTRNLIGFCLNNPDEGAKLLWERIDKGIEEAEKRNGS